MKNVYGYYKAYKNHGLEGLRDKRNGIPDEVKEIILQHLKYKCSCCNADISLTKKYNNIKEELVIDYIVLL